MGFVLIDFKKIAERKELKQLVPTIDDVMDDWIAAYGEGDETPPTEDECAALEDEQINERLAQFDEEAEKLWRVADEVPERRELLVANLELKRGKLFRKFSGVVASLMEQAEVTMKRCMQELDSSEDEVKKEIPTTEETIESEFELIKERCTKYVEKTYPDGVAGLDSYDEGLPEGIPTFAEFMEMVDTKKEEYKQMNAEAIPASIERVKENSRVMFSGKVNDAIKAAMAAIETEIDSDVTAESLPFLSEDDVEALRATLLEASKEYCTSRLDE